MNITKITKAVYTSSTGAFFLCHMDFYSPKSESDVVQMVSRVCQGSGCAIDFIYSLDTYFVPIFVSVVCGLCPDVCTEGDRNFYRFNLRFRFGIIFLHLREDVFKFVACI